MTSPPLWKSFKHQGALAFLKQEMFCQLPIASPTDLKGLEEAIRRSKYLRYTDSKENAALEFNYELRLVTLRNQQGVRIASQYIENAQEALSQSFSDILKDAERLARARRVLGLRCERKEERLRHYVDIQVGIVEDGKPSRIFQLNSDNHVKEGERVYVLLENKGLTPVHTSVFNINIAGCISLITMEDLLGITLFPDDSPEILGANAFSNLRGLVISWPEGISRNIPVEEWLFIVLSSSPVDLRYLCDSVDRDLTINLARNTEKQSSKKLDIHYNIVLIPFKLHPLTTKGKDNHMIREVTPAQSGESCIYMQAEGAMEGPQQVVLAAELPEPEFVLELSGTLSYPPTVVPKGILGAILRSNIPPCMWVVNQHKEEITVVVSKYRPNHMLSGVSLNVSTAGAGIEFNTVTFNGPATKKTLSPHRTDNGASTAAFPLWTRKEAFGVISIFKGREKTLYIENDRVPLGATAYFANKPDLMIIEYAAGN